MSAPAQNTLLPTALRLPLPSGISQTSERHLSRKGFRVEEDPQFAQQPQQRQQLELAPASTRETIRPAQQAFHVPMDRSGDRDRRDRMLSNFRRTMSWRNTHRERTSN